jgi:predicted metalloprotease
MMAWSYRKNERHRNSKKDVVRKAAFNKMKGKTKNERAG